MPEEATRRGRGELRRIPRLLPVLLLAACAPSRPATDALPPTPSVSSAADPPAPAPSGETPPEPTVRAWPVMGTLLEVTVWEEDEARAADALRRARAAVFRVDTLMSTYRPESELSAVNRRAGGDTATVVDPWTAEVLAASLAAAEETGGAFDPTVGPLVDVWGFHRERGGIPPAAARDSATLLTGWRRVEWAPETRSVRLPDAGMRLDFGAVAKGYAVDRAVVALRGAGVRRAMVDLGGNLRFVGTAPGGGRWAVGLRHPRDPEGPPLAVTLLEDGEAVATSGDYERFFVHDGVRYSHLLDPRSGRPVRGVAAVSVVAPTGVRSDLLSTALFVLGPEEGCRLLASIPGVGALWVRDAGEEGEIGPDDLTVGGEPGERMEFDGVEGEPRRCGGTRIDGATG